MLTASTDNYSVLGPCNAMASNLTSSISPNICRFYFGPACLTAWLERGDIWENVVNMLTASTDNYSVLGTMQRDGVKPNAKQKHTHM